MKVQVKCQPYLSADSQERLEHGWSRPCRTRALLRKVGIQKARAPRLKVEAVIPSVDHM